MGSQFAHIELWTARGSSRKGKRRWSAREILSEMAREPGACDHVKKPQKPILLHGIEPMQLADELEKTALELKDGRGRSTASRARVLMAAVYSFPTEREKASFEDEKKWAKDVVDFNFKFFGKEHVRTIVAHTDEKFFHLHVALTAPREGNRLAWEAVHPGIAGEALAVQEGANPKQKRSAYLAAMRRFQDSFFREVASKHGHARIGPRRRRLSREEWHAEQRVTSLLEKASGKSMPELLIASHWRDRFEAAEKEKNAAVQRARTAEKQAEKFRTQIVRLLKKLKRHVREKLWRGRIRAAVPEYARQRERQRERKFV